jgi:hypothetical protein
MPNELTEAEKLAALDRAATQGQWVPNEVGGGAFSTWDHMPVLAGKTMDVELCCKLVNAYRANQLVLIGPDAVEKVARAIGLLKYEGLEPPVRWPSDPLDALKGVHTPTLTWEYAEHCRRLSTAALAALGVK